ncbi:33348_t:CDS:2, partial [Gigaspora margarita]
KKIEEELGNLSQKIEQIALNYAASTSNRPKVPFDDDRRWSARDGDKRRSNWPGESRKDGTKEPRRDITCFKCGEIGHIARCCLSERKPKRDPEERHGTNYVGWFNPYDNDPEAWDENEVYALGTWENRLRPRDDLLENLGEEPEIMDED